MTADATADIDRLWALYKSEGGRDVRDALILHYSPLVKYVAGRVAVGLPQNVEQADLVSYGIFGLIDAIEKFDLDRGYKFETYAIARIKGAILDELLSGSEGGEGQSTLVDTIADGSDDPVEAFEVQEIKQILAEAVEGMPERERLVLTLYYYEGLTLAEIGQVLGVTESRVCQIHTKAVIQLRSRLAASEREPA